MSVNVTSNLGLHIWNEDEIVNFEEFNENFQKIDNLLVITEFGTKTANTTGGTDNIVTWYYRIFDNETVDMYAKLSYDSLKCGNGDAAPYLTDTLTVSFPFGLSEIRDVHMHMASSTKGWVFNTTESGVLDKLSFQVGSFTKETTNNHKDIFISLKGKVVSS